jgi:sialidase-1
MPATHEPVFERQPLFTPHHRGKWKIDYRCPTLVVSKKGTIFALPSVKFNVLTDWAKSELCLRRSFDHGKSWTDTEILRTDEDPRVTYHYLAGVADFETGRVLLFYMTHVVITPQDIGGQWLEQWEKKHPGADKNKEGDEETWLWEREHPKEAAELCRKMIPGIELGYHLIWTDDEGETWSEPIPVGNEMYVLNPVTGERRQFVPQWVGTQLRYGPKRGRLIVPGIGISAGAPFAQYAYSHNCTFYSDDHGRTWQLGGLGQNGSNEACLVEQIDGTVYVNSRNESLRARGYRAWDRSRDGGETFLESGYDLGLPEPHCEGSMVRYSGPPEDRSRVLFCNPAVTSNTPSDYDHQARHHLTVRISYDECRTWPVGRIVCEGLSGYSSLAVARDGTILCAYETLTPQWYTGEIVLARFNLAWLTQGRTEPIILG